MEELQFLTDLGVPGVSVAAVLAAGKYVFDKLLPLLSQIAEATTDNAVAIAELVTELRNKGGI